MTDLSAWEVEVNALAIRVLPDFMCNSPINQHTAAEGIELA